MPTEGISGANPAQEAQAAAEARETAETKPSGTPPPMTGGAGSLGKFKAENPELWDKMLIAMATEMTNKMRKDQEHLKKIMREGQKR